jgi:hypothetical protein
MALSLESISNAKRMRAPRIVLLGTSGIGKSEFAAGADNAVYMPVKGEEGIDALDVQAFPVINTYDEAMQGIGALYEGDHEYQTLVMDSASTFASLVDEWAVMTEGVKDKANLGGGFGRQFDTILGLWRALMGGMDALRNDKNMTIVIIGHVRIRSSRDPETESFDQWSFDIDRQVGDALIRWSDCTLFMGRKTIVKKTDGGFGKKEKQGTDITGGQRFLFTQETPTHPGKSRGYFGNLPAEIPLPRHSAWQAFMDAITVAAQ